MSFKLLAIRPLEGCDKDYLKILEKNIIYQFYNDYEFILDEEQKEVLEIKYKPTIPENLFNVSHDSNDLIHPKKEIEINISAVVGKNGSGKSTLSELLLYSLFRISNKFNFINVKHKSIYEHEVYKTNVEKSETKFSCEIYYSIDNIIYKIIINARTINFYKQEIGSKKFIITDDIISKNDFEKFFYTMIVNYSFYAFNSNEIGIWIKAFFHKNDGYQMPIVINPYRDEGNMDINNEIYLTRSRLLANILSIKDYKNINSKSELKKVELLRDGRKFNNYREIVDGENVYMRFSKGFRDRFKEKILKPLFEKMMSYKIEGKIVKIEYPDFNDDDENDNRVFAEYYLINKLITISTRYASFKKYDCRRNLEKDIEDNFDIDELNIDEFINDIYEDRSHVTLKIRQTLNYIRKNIFSDRYDDGLIDVDLPKVILKMNELIKENFFTELVDYLPPPIFFNEIYFEDDSIFTNMSSGEKQQIFSMNSIIYHLKNIDSVHFSLQKNKDLIKYDTINFLFDEIELYFHPEFQKNHISKLLDFIKSAKFENIKKLNILFLTHSPFILSDIPKQNVLFLEDGKPKDFSNMNTFGANITDLLANSFFINDSLIGDFAKGKINEVIKWLNDEKRDSDKKDDYKKIIEMIDEPVVKYKLREKFDGLFSNYDEIELLRKSAEKLGYNIEKK